MPSKERTETSLSNADTSRLKRAIELAKISECTNKHGAVITIGGKIVAVGINRMRNDPSQFPVSHFEPNDISVHAEVAALRALGGEAKGAKIYIARWHGKTCKTSLSRPCDNCYAALVDAGVKEIIYTL